MRAALFDEEWYRNHGPGFDGDPWMHFATLGWRAMRDPHPLFRVRHYVSQQPDLADGEDPVSHYLRTGAAQGLSPHPLFDPAFYCTRYAHLLEDDNPLVHFVTVGRDKALDPNPFFDVSWYLERNDDVRDSDTNPVVHYASFGNREWERRPHRLFDPRAYAVRHGLEPGAHPLEHFLERYGRLRRRTFEVEVPLCSAVILNFNKAVMTLQCVLELLASDGIETMEVVVVDNGSDDDDFARLTAGLPLGVRVIRLLTNRYFGEGNNIGVEDSRGRYVLFLNNDAFVSTGTYLALRSVLERHADAGAAGPKFIYPDGRLQEAGGSVSECGLITQRGKYLENERGRFAAVEPTDYISAACLLVPRAVLDEVAGFDLAWEPAYYEDVDLCFKISLLGLKTYYCGQTVVAHIENVTSGDASLNLGLGNIVEINREKFIARWSDFVRRGHDPAAALVRLPPQLTPEPAANRPLAVLYTPYPLVPGGGERYILSIAEALSRDFQTILITPERYSNYRLRTLAADLGLDLSRVRLEPASELTAYGDCDLFIAIGNEVLPPVRGMGKQRLYICQFPFPMHIHHAATAWNTLDTYQLVVVYSAFVARHFTQRAAAVSRFVPEVVVLPPAVPQMLGTRSDRDPGRILHVGRFAPDGHAKRQDTLLEAFRRLTKAVPAADLELHFVGTIPADPNCRKYFTRVRDAARGLPVSFHINAPAESIGDLYARTSFYWHATGFGQNETYNPQRFEHFGISVLEAMSAGAIPFVYDAAGPAEVVVPGSNGFQWHSIDDLVELAQAALAMDAAPREALRLAAMQTAKRFDIAIFRDRLFTLIERLRRPARVPSESADLSTTGLQPVSSET